MENSDVFYRGWNESNDVSEFNSANVLEYPLGQPVRINRI